MNVSCMNSKPGIQTPIRPVRIIGIGSPFGDDRLGWVAADMLKHSPVLDELPAGMVSISVCDRPGPLLFQEWNPADRVILIDAVRSDAAAGTLHELNMNDIQIQNAQLSSHGFGVAETLALAGSLEQLPSWIELFGIEADADHTGDDLSPSVRSTLARLVRRIETEISLLSSEMPCR